MTFLSEREHSEFILASQFSATCFFLSKSEKNPLVRQNCAVFFSPGKDNRDLTGKYYDAQLTPIGKKMVLSRANETLGVSMK
jgi:hypothetical protein